MKLTSKLLFVAPFGNDDGSKPWRKLSKIEASCQTFSSPIKIGEESLAKCLGAIFN